MYANRLKIIDKKSYQPNHNGGYDVKLLRNRSMIWSCNVDLVSTHPPFLQCLNYAITGQVLTPDFILEKCGLTNEEFMKKYFKENSTVVNPVHQHELAILYNVVIDYHIPYPILGGKEIKYSYSLGFNPTNLNPRIIAFLEIPNNSQGVKDYFTLLLPNLKKKLPLVHKFYYCETCNSWMSNKKWVQHKKECRKCLQCGCAYKIQSGHEKTCIREHAYIKEKRTPKDEIRRYKLDEKLDFSFNYYADFEAFVPPNERNYEVYAGAYIGSNPESWKYPKMFYGKGSLDRFMRKTIQHCRGVMWFFNGSRYDNFFILRWLFENKIPIDRRSLLISGNNVLCVKYKTEKGWLQLKDLAKFLQGSLAECCENYSLGDQSKTDFDHMKMTSWDAVYQHREECEEYLKMDVISLRALQQVFAKQIFNILKIDMMKYMTLTQVGYASWSAQIPKKMKIYKTPVGEEERIMREMYKGGRVFCGRKQWRSKWYKEVMDSRLDYMEIDPNLQKENPDLTGIFCMKEDGECITQELYDKIDDYLAYADVNSLYPWVQISTKYPLKDQKGKPIEDLNEETIGEVPKKLLSHFIHGRHKFTELKYNSTDEQQYRLELNERHSLQKEKWYRTGVCVDITCPDDLTVAFLMTKHPKTGEVVQDLLPKEKTWYTGPELWEASKLGFKITRIYSICEWDKSSPMFINYVLPLYKLKSAQESDGPIRNTSKSALNALTGKYGQKNVPKTVVLFDPNEQIDVDIVNLTQIVNQKGECLKFYALEVKEFKYSPFPIEISAWILSLARVYMSKLLRKMGIERGHGPYRNEYRFSPFYSDTDSLIVHIEAWNKLLDHYKGKKLGQLKLEIDGKIISFVCLANKTYSIVYVDRKTLKIMCITKTKGIPHGGKAYNACEHYVASQEEQTRALSHSQFLQNRRDKKFPSFIFAPNSLNIKSRAYVFKDAITKEVKFVCSKIPHEFLFHILDRSWTMECIFGGMVRQFKPGGLENLFIAPETKSRSLCMTDWWGQKKRIHSVWDTEEWPSAYPVGHYKVKGQERKKKIQINVNK